MPRASTQDIANLAGVSKMTVSRVLRGEGGSRHQEKVLEAARQLDYIPVRTAIQNRRAKTQVIGVLEEGDFLFSTQIGAETLRGVARAAFQQGYDLLMLRPQHHYPLEQRKVQFLDKRCEGFIFVVSQEHQEIMELLVENDIPAVTCYTTDVPATVSYVVPDNEKIVDSALQLLIKHGHRHIAYYSGHQGHSDARERTAAFARGMQQAGLPLRRHSYIWDHPEDELTSQAYLPPLPGEKVESQRDLLSNYVTAIICHNDHEALWIWEQAIEWGLKIPEDLSIVGIDNIPEAQIRGLTTFQVSFFEIGRTAAQSLHALINDGLAQDNSHRLASTLVERDSVAAPRLRNVAS